MNQDGLGERIKKQYEDRTRYLLPRRTYTIIRVDGKAFHTYTRKFVRPFDDSFIDAMDRTAVALCEGIQGAHIGFVQSDEISIVLTDMETEQTDAWFDGNLQKIVSVAASMATMVFNRAAGDAGLAQSATFDARAFTIPDRQEVFNYLIWRQKDASRNSIQAVAQSLYLPSELYCKQLADLHQLLHEKGINWNDYKPRYKHGAACTKSMGPAGCEVPSSRRWACDYDTPIFSQSRSYLEAVVPEHGYTHTQELLVGELTSIPRPHC